MLSIRIGHMEYTDQTESFCLENIHFSIEKGEIIWLKGNVGCGKTTLLKLISGVIPYLEPCNYTGEILLNGQSITPEIASKNIAFCFQTPEHQFLFDTVKRQFLLEASKAQTTLKVLFSSFGIDSLLCKSIKDLSSGERKLIAILSTIYKDRSVFLFDEITSNLDDKYIEKVLELIRDNKKNRITIIASHDTRVGEISNRSIWFNDSEGIWCTGDFPIQNNLKDNQITSSLETSDSTDNSSINHDPIFSCEQVFYFYPDGSIGLDNISCCINRGEIVGLFGANGSGKSTLLKLITKKISPTRGQILHNHVQKYGMLLQENEKQLFTFSVWDEITLGLKRNKDKDSLNEANILLKRLGLFDYKNAIPFFLSVGQKQKLLIAAILIHHPDLLILDEPFASLDHTSINAVLDLLMEYYRAYRPTMILVDQDDELFDSIAMRKIPIMKDQAPTS